MKTIYTLFWLCFGSIVAFVCTEPVKLAMKNFQLNFLSAIEEIVQNETAHYIDELLDLLQKNSHYNAYETEIKMAKQTKQLEAKTVFVKQLLDIDTSDPDSEEHFYILRNINFFKKLKMQLQKFEEESIQELRELRMYRVCKQFQANNKTSTTTMSNSARKSYYPYSRTTKLVPINEINIGEMLEELNIKDNHTVSVDLKAFGHTLYDNIKIEGAEIIDDYLHSIRKLLQEVNDEKTDEYQPSDKINKVLAEIDAILKITDFFEKREKLYGYLETGLNADYEDFRATEFSQHDVAEIFAKLNERGLNLFVSFLFSNFQFLEHLHNEWRKLLPEAPVGLYDEQTKQLHDVHHYYNKFKTNQESNDQYETYIKHVTDLHEKTKNVAMPNLLDGHSRVFEVLHNSSKNLGRVTLNMIRDKCDQFQLN